MGVGLEIRVGDLVQLRSGGQIMTVHDHDSERVSCIWHDREGRFQQATMNRRVVQKVSPTGSDNLTGGVSIHLSNQVSEPPSLTPSDVQ
jgi:uncharacterized protein YodC (DUF2158 family)